MANAFQGSLLVVVWCWRSAIWQICALGLVRILKEFWQICALLIFSCWLEASEKATQSSFVMFFINKFLEVTSLMEWGSYCLSLIDNRLQCYV